MLHPATQATLSSILLSGVPGYTPNTPSPPPGLAPIDKQPNGVPECTLNGHVKVGPPPTLYCITSLYILNDCDNNYFLFFVRACTCIALWLSVWEDNNSINCRKCLESSSMWLSPGSQWPQSIRTTVKQVQPGRRYSSNHCRVSLSLNFTCDLWLDPCFHIYT